MIKRVSADQQQDQIQAEAPDTIQYLSEKPKVAFGEHLVRNLALAGMLVLCITAIRNTKLPDGQTILTAVQQMVDTNWDDSLGKISFVSNLFPETVSVFFQSTVDTQLIAPCFGEITHVWSENEPYVGYHTNNGNQVFAAASGQVMSIAHGLQEEKIIRIRHDNGLETLYYNLASAAVQEGDVVSADICIGECLANSSPIIEVRKDGAPIDPTAFLSPRMADTL